MNSTIQLANPIDAVITWVDGSDPRHIKKRAEYFKSIGMPFSEDTMKTRFADSGEIYYCIKSILKYAPWIQNIYLVTDEQTPNFLNLKAEANLAAKIKIVDHKTIFKGNEQHLPTFNSQTISTMLWKIPDLADQFLYFNDDIFLVNPVSPEDFFRERKMVLRGKWKRTGLEKRKEKLIRKLAPFSKKLEHKANRPKNKIAQRKSAEIYGFNNKAFFLEHLPHPMRASTLKNFFDASPNILESQIKYPIRAPGQFTAEGLAAHLELLNGTAIIDNKLKGKLLKCEKDSIQKAKRLFSTIKFNRRKPFLCVQALDMASDEYQALVLKKLEDITSP